MRGIYLPLFLTVSLSLAGQVGPNVQAKKIDDKVTVDGLLDEAFWQNAGTATDFIQYFPNDSVDATLETEVKLPMTMISYMLESLRNLQVQTTSLARFNAISAERRTITSH